MDAFEVPVTRGFGVVSSLEGFKEGVMRKPRSREDGEVTFSLIDHKTITKTDRKFLHITKTSVKKKETKQRT